MYGEKEGSPTKVWTGELWQSEPYKRVSSWEIMLYGIQMWHMS